MMDNYGRSPESKFRSVAAAAPALILALASTQVDWALTHSLAAFPPRIAAVFLAGIALACLLAPIVSALNNSPRIERLVASARRILARPGIKKRLFILEYAQPLLLALLTYIIASKFAASGIEAHHDGVMFKPALDVSEGKIIFRDTFTQYGALTTLLQALALEFSGRYLIAIKLQTAFFYSAIVYFLWLVWKRFIPQWLATVCGLVYIGMAPYFSVGFMPWSSVYALFFLVLSLYFLVFYAEHRAWPYICAAGVSCALTLWSRQPVGFFLFWAIALFQFCLVLIEKAGWKNYLKQTAAFMSAFVAVNIVFISGLMFNGALKDMWLQAVVHPFIWIRSSALFSQQTLFAVLFPRNSGVAQSFPEYVWIVLPISCMIVFAFSVVRCLRKKFFAPAQLATFAAATVCLASWGQYYPVPCISHTYWAAAPMIGVFAFLVWNQLKRTNFSYKGVLALSAMSLLFQADISSRITAAGIRLRSEYVELAYPEVLKGMRVAPREAQFFEIIASDIDEYFGRRPEGGLLNLTPDALFGTFRKNILNFHPLTMHWKDFDGIYPDYIPSSLDYSHSSRPLVVSSNYPVIHDGYTIRSLLQNNHIGLSQNVYVSAPGDSGSAWYITAFGYGAGAPWEPPAKNYFLDMQYASAHARAIRAVGVTARGLSGTLSGAWQPGARTEDMITLNYLEGPAAGGPKSLEPEFLLPAGGKVKLLMTGYHSSSLQPVKLKITTVMDDNTRFQQEISFMPQDK